MSFRMKVKDIFRIGGKTVFSGRLETQEKSISNSPTHLEIDGAFVGEIQIAGEVHTRSPQRDLWTVSPVDLDRQTLREHDVWLVSAKAPSRTKASREPLRLARTVASK
jgi:hypothetical protein